MKKKILVSVDSGETRVAVLEGKGSGRGQQRRGRGRKNGEAAEAEATDQDGQKGQNGKGRNGAAAGGENMRVGELYVERRGSRSIVGNIYMGVVDNVLPGMEAAFVDIGLERNGFLHVDEIVTADGQVVPKRGRGKGKRIDELLKPKQEILVQVVKDPLKTKGARLSMQLSIAGRYLVYMPQGSGVGASRRLSDNERDRQRKLLNKLHDGKGGVIVRTAAEGADKADFERDLAYLHRLHEVVEKRAAEVKGPDLVFQEADLSIRVLRDVLGKEFDGAIIDDEKQHQRVTSFFQRTAPELCDLVELYDGKDQLFERYGADKAIRSTLSRRVDLPSGGYLIIDYAEALTVIDINTGSFTGRGKGRLEDTITRVNVEAAEEVVRQLRLRDIGGIIVIDFIDMARAKNRDQVLKTLQKALDEDRTKTYVMEVSPLGLVEMTRQNVTDGVREILTRKCPTCDGEGVIPSEETVAIDVLRKLHELVNDPNRAGDEAFLIRVNPKVAAELVREDSGLLELEQESGRWFHFEGGDALPVDTFEVSDSGSREDIEQRALPFQVGEEVLVTIEEPHMYDVDDAIARLDAYIVSVVGGGRHVGERRLVRIDSVARSSATASLVDPDGPPTEPAPGGGQTSSDGNSNGDGSGSRRRRGRRGGRGRRGSRSGAGSQDSDGS
ncbi:Rne/Rng family ribonuclease [Thermoleophilia bacterium SCSIO 60948]|nr:Rne/Rng family ribonuclease [Thermoleophilia bacterium SCSIO 60948]